MKKLLIILLLIATSVSASDWAGHNGTVILSFESDKVVRVAEVESVKGMGVLVDVYATLTDISELSFNKSRVLTCGGYELQLQFEGSEGKIISQNLPKEAQINVAKEAGRCMVGLFPDISLAKGPQIAHWQVLLPEGAKNVRFSLTSEGLFSTDRVKGCAENNPVVLWVGGQDASHHGLMFAAVCAPAYLNWDGEPELELIRGTMDSIETGLFTIED